MYETIVLLYVLVTVYFKISSSHNVWVRSFTVDLILILIETNICNSCTTFYQAVETNI